MYRSSDIKFSTRLVGALLCSLWAVLFLGAAAPVAAGVIENVEIDTSREPARIQITLTRPLAYLNHAPATQADELHIQLRALPSALEPQADENETRTVSAADNRQVPLLDVSYSPGAPGDGTLTLRFRHQVHYEVQAGADRRHLIVLVPVATGAPGAPETAVAAGTRPDQGRAGNTPSMFVLGGNRYIVNLESSTRPIAKPVLDIPDPDQYFVYTAELEIDRRTWYRLRAGFFASRADARLFVEAIRHQYPRAWVAFAEHTEVSAALEQLGLQASGDRPPQRPEEQVAMPATPAPTAIALEPGPGDADSGQALPSPGTAPVPAVIAPTPLPAAPAVAAAATAPADHRTQTLMEEARQAMAQANYSRAIQLYSKILRPPEHALTRDALEYLGVARERNGQLAHAINEYQHYLERYPDSEGADRIRQRLAGLTTATERPHPAARRPDTKDAAIPWQVYGGLAQYYRRDESTTDSSGDIVTQSSLVSSLDLSARRRGQRMDLQSRFSGSLLNDFLDDGSGDRSSVSNLFFDAKDKRLGWSMRLGRQSRHSGGVLGRFDGLLAGYQLNDSLTINAVAGFPVASAHDQVKTDKRLYGLSADLGTFANAWDFNLFFIEQWAEDILDRRAIGGEARYFDPHRSMLTFIDYDVSYSALNTAIILGTWTLPDRTTINAGVDYRNSPILTTSNALQGQTARSLDALQDSFSEQELRELAEDRTGESTTVTLGVSRPFSESLQLSADLAVSSLSGTPASGGVEAIPDTGEEYFYNLQLIGSNLLTSGDISIVGLRYADTSNAAIYSLLLNSRYPLNSHWRINPRLRVDYRENERDDSDQWLGAPSLRVDYRLRKHFRLEFEAGGEWSTRRLNDGDENTSSWFINAGYRLDF